MKKRALLSIHPEYAEAILRGHKEFEFRRVVFKQAVGEILIYATLPVARIVGRFTVDDIYSGAPRMLWSQTRRSAGVTKERFEAYFDGRSLGFAIKVANPIRFARPQPLSRYVSSNVPPQSFCYV